MNKYRIIITPFFNNKLIDYLSIYSYSIIKNIVNKIYNEIYSLDILPKRYHYIKENDYCFVVMNYRIYYSVYDADGIVVIKNIYYTRENDKNIR